MSKEKNGNVWVFIEQDGGKMAEVSLELVCKATELAKILGVKTEAVLLGGKVNQLAPRLFELGCDTVYAGEDKRLEPYTALPYTKVLCEVVNKYKPQAVLFGATHVGRSLAPRVASTLRCGLTADCTDLQIDDFDDKQNNRVLHQRLMQIRPAFGGNIIATIATSWDGPQMVTVREGVMKMHAPTPGREGKIVPIGVELTDAETVVSIIERHRAEKTVDLKGAQIIVSGGYGMHNKEGFALVKQLAAAVGGEVGASRAAVDAGWVDHDHQVGQTGTTVRPRLYIACGISGSVQHRAGMDASSKIIAINTDPNAPIFAVAHYGIVGDVHEVLPMLIKAYKGRV